MILYHIEFVGNDEHFEKIGITKYDVFKRFGSKTTAKYKNYNIRILELLDVPNDICRILESEIHKEYSDFSYVPLLENFSGKTECFSPNIIDISKYKKIYNRYKNIKLDNKPLNRDSIQYFSKKLKLKIKKIYKKSELTFDEITNYNSIFYKKPLTALIKNKKLYAKELDNGYYYKIEDNIFTEEDYECL
jgi:hypothetical protein